MDLIRSYKFRIYPDAKLQGEIDKRLELSCGFYNLLLEKSILSYKKNGTNISMAQLNRFANQATIENRKYLQIYSQTRCDIKYRVLRAYQNFFRRCKQKKNGSRVRVGFPRFRSRDRYSSITYPQYNGSFSLEMERKTRMLRISRIGRVRIEQHREINGGIKRMLIKKEEGRYYAIFTAIDERKKIKAVEDTNPVGMDMGLNSFIALSDGKKIEKPKFMRRKETRRIAIWQRRLAKRKSGSNRRGRAKQEMQKRWEHITNQSNDFAHKLIHELVNSGYTSFATEKLQIQHMVRNHNLAQSIHNASWNRFLNILSYKAESAGMRFAYVDPANTTKICSNCGNMVDMPLSQRTYVCGRCGMERDRDINAAINILKRATVGHTEGHARGDSVRPQNEAVAEEPRTYPAIAGGSPRL